jgi:hypothetical protein
MGLESTIPVFERAKIFHVLDRAASEIGSQLSTYIRRHVAFGKADESLVCSDKT